MYQAIAVHHARPEHVEAFKAYMGRVRAAVGDAPGLIEFGGWSNGDAPDLVAVSRWESEADFRAALPRIMSLADERRPEWSARPDDLYTGVSF
jgi:heme-degrading monooxygenase HmoA